MSVYALRHLQENPQVYYRLDDRQTPLFDFTGHGFSGLVSGSVTFGQPGALADLDTAISFASGGSLLFPGSVPFLSWSAFTLEFWLFLDGAWSLIALVYSQGSLSLFLNGQPYTSGNGSAILIDTNCWWVGNSGSGVLDEVVLYSYALSNQTIAQNFQLASYQEAPLSRFAPGMIPGPVFQPGQYLFNGTALDITPQICTLPLTGGTLYTGTPFTLIFASVSSLVQSLFITGTRATFVSPINQQVSWHLSMVVSESTLMGSQLLVTCTILHNSIANV